MRTPALIGWALLVAVAVVSFVWMIAALGLQAAQADDCRDAGGVPVEAMLTSLQGPFITCLDRSALNPEGVS